MDLGENGTVKWFGVIRFNKKMYLKGCRELFQSFDTMLTWLQPRSTHEAEDSVQRLIDTQRYPSTRLGVHMHCGGSRRGRDE